MATLPQAGARVNGRDVDRLPQRPAVIGVVLRGLVGAATGKKMCGRGFAGPRPVYSLLEQLLSKQDSLGRLIALALVGLAVILAVAFGAYYLSQPEREPLYTGLSRDDIAMAITVKIACA